MNIPASDLPRIVVIGAGFAGLQVAKKVDTTRYQLVLLDKNNYHLFQPLLYQVSSSGLEPDSIAYPIRKVLRQQKNTHYRLADVQHINTESSQLLTDIGRLSYDKLVIATGANNNFFGIDSIEREALTMKSLTDALNIRSKLLGNYEKALNTTDREAKLALMRVVIVGGGPTGVELAGALAELNNKILPKDFPDLDLSLTQIHLVESSSRILSAMSEHSSTKATKALEKLGVKVYTDMEVTSYQNTIATTNSDTNFRTDTLIWAAGVRGEFPKGIADKIIGKGNRIIADGYCRIKGLDEVYVLGDACLIQTEKYPDGLPMLAAVAMQQGKYLAGLFNDQSKQKQTEPFDYLDKGTMATIGRNKAVVETKGLKFSGITAWFVWMSVHLVLLIGFRNRMVVLINWIWNYVRYNNGLRLIVRPYKKQKIID